MGVQSANFVGHLGSDVNGGSNACPLKQRDFSRAMERHRSCEERRASTNMAL